MGKRRRARELAIQVLFHLEFSNDDPGAVFGLVCEHFKSQGSNRSFSKRLVLGVCEKKQELDTLIINASKHWRLERMSSVDRCILRLAAFEMLFLEDVPPRVSIDEAVEMGKKFGSEYSAGFLNGVLDNIYSSLLGECRIKQGGA